MKAFGCLLALLLSVAGAFGDTVPHELTLRQCFDLALEHNPQLRTASTQFLFDEGRSVKLHAILYPSVNAQAISTPLVFYVQIQEILYSEATLPQLRLARLTREEAFLNYRQALVDVLFQVRQAFTSAVGAQMQAQISRDLITSRQAAVKTSQDLFAAGKLQRSDVSPLQVMASLSRQSAALSGLTNQQAVLTLAQVIGVDLPIDEQLDGEIKDQGPAKLDVAALSAQAARGRTDLQLLENARLSSRQQIAIDMKSAYPEIGFQSNSAIQPPSFLPGGADSYDLERNYSEPETQRQNGNTQLPLSLYFNWLIFDGGKREGVKAGDQATLATQQEAVEALKRAIPGEVAQAVTVIETERALLKLFGDQPPSGLVERESTVDYQAGRVRLLDKVNLETDIALQRQLRLASQIRLSLALAALDHALGRGLEAPRSPASN